MRKFTIKSLLVTAALCLGTSVWAEEVTATLVHTASTSCRDNNTEVTGTVDVEKEHYNNEGSGTWQGYAFAEFEFDIPENHVVVSAQLTWTGTTTTRARNHVLYYLNLGNELDYDVISTSPSLLRYNGNKKHIVTESFANEATKVADVTSAINDVYDNNSNKIIFQWTGNAGGGDLYGKASDKAPKLVITTADATVTTSYTINYKFGEETVYSTSGTLAVGATVNTESVIIVDDVKYLSVGDVQNYTITADGTNTWDVEVRKPYTATVNLVNTIAGVESEPVTTTFTETDDKVCTWTVGYPMYVLKDGVYYKLDGDIRGESGTFEDKQTINKTANYTNADNTVAYFTEVEDISSTSLTSFNASYSAGHCSAIAANGKTICTLEAGAYNVETYIQANTNRGFYLRDGNNGDNNTNTMCSGSAIGTYTGSFVIGTSTPIIISGYTNSYGKLNQSSELDYVLITKVPNPTVTITSAGYATFSSTYAVDFSESGLAAYTAKVNDGNATITLTAIEDGIVPANTGVILKGEAGDYTGAITTTDATVDNDLKANATEITGNGSIYVLNNGTQGIGFYQLSETGTLAAGKAYLEITSSAKAYTFVWNESTGIEENYEFGTMSSDAATYDLSGRKVANPAKGLYIKNGKKFIVK